MLSASAQFKNAGECTSQAAAMRESVAAGWQLKFKPSPDNGWYAAVGTSELDLVCVNSTLRVDVRDLSALRAQSAELQGYTTSITCDSTAGSQAGSERAGPTLESFAPMREVSYGEARVPLERIAQRLQFFHGQLINRRRCLRQGQLRYSIVVDATGRVVDARLLDSSFTPSFLAVAEREIRRERFESDATPGYRQIEFALTLRAQ
jgi:hypothetical protein